MKIYKLGIILGLLLAAAPFAQARAWCDVCDWKNLFKSEPEQRQPQAVRVVTEGPVSINLQNPYTRKIARCYNNNISSAEECARYFERYGFIRFREIPYKTANYDFLHVDTFPTRRWRDSELTPRW
ncbi:MAG: hypothetical protein KHX55_00025 [Proteobacteria bacterium]|nr:hypothetical protein [Pseudomonadota bacterium]